ncbi:hypothetical protein A2V80_02335 [Candidatus Woesebacteria bacterium RBG_16_39_8b]|uniref:Uncharacterized protein n=1 Tax=Candidatus Woesebacteria bacterium RBG_16_39_8b TaxID=1802482 RepID=A0A1F7XBC3_9BACT|nr:MAG: hypothetical protein A2V80_02335 [Candidatus Woesebacteria bacterium RBG_16_39_8b]
MICRQVWRSRLRIGEFILTSLNRKNYSLQQKGEKLMNQQNLGNNGSLPERYVYIYENYRKEIESIISPSQHLMVRADQRSIPLPTVILCLFEGIPSPRRGGAVEYRLSERNMGGCFKLSEKLDLIAVIVDRDHTKIITVEFLTKKRRKIREKDRGYRRGRKTVQMPFMSEMLEAA